MLKDDINDHHMARMAGLTLYSLMQQLPNSPLFALMDENARNRVFKRFYQIKVGDEIIDIRVALANLKDLSPELIANYQKKGFVFTPSELALKMPLSVIDQKNTP